MPGGRPPIFTPQILDEVLEWISKGKSEYGFFLQEGRPGWSTWTKYKREHPEFIAKYLWAKADGYQVWEYEIDKISHDESRDMQPDGKGGFKSDNTAVNRDRLKVDTRKWLMSKLLSKVYGDRVSQEVTGADGGPIQYEAIDRPQKESFQSWQQRVQASLEERKKLAH